MKRFAVLISMSVALISAMVAVAVAADNLDYWLDQAKPDAAEHVATPPPPAPATQPAAKPAAPPTRPDALSGAMEISDGRLLAGGIYTTRGKDLEIWVEGQKRWRHIPLLILRGIHAVEVSSGYENQWRWKEMGRDEKVYTGRRRPIRRLQWRLNLIDGTSLTGEIKGQPLWIEYNGRRTQQILSARTKGAWDEELADLVYLKHVVFSRREMRRVKAIIGDAAEEAMDGRP